MSATKKPPQGRHDPAVLVSRHLLGLATAMRGRVRDGLLERGHRLSTSSTQVIPNLPPEGLGMSELASRLRLSLQRTGQLVQQLEEDGYAERIPDERDGRAKRVVYSRRGRKLVEDINEITNEVNDELAEAVGKDRYERFTQDLADLDGIMNGVDAPLRLGDKPDGSA